MTFPPDSEFTAIASSSDASDDSVLALYNDAVTTTATGKYHGRGKEDEPAQPR